MVVGKNIFTILIAVLICSCNLNKSSEQNDDLESLFKLSINKLKVNKNINSFRFDNVIKFHEWERACMVKPYMSMVELEQNLGFPYQVNSTNENKWILLLTKDKSVVGVISIDRSDVEVPNIKSSCFDRENLYLSNDMNVLKFQLMNGGKDE